MNVNEYEKVLDRARMMLGSNLPALGKESVLARLIESGVPQDIAFFAVRGAQVLEIQLNKKK